MMIVEKRSRPQIVFICLLAFLFYLNFIYLYKAYGSNSRQPTLTEMVQTWLTRPTPERWRGLQALGAPAYRELVQLSFDETRPMSVRWKALMALPHLAGVDAKPDLEKAIKSHVWFMKNASLLAMSKIDREVSLEWSKKLLFDPSLLVRRAAVDVMQKAHDVNSIPLLWKALYAKENSRRGKSLFIRRRILEALSVLEKSGQEFLFVSVLERESESELYEPALQALERLTTRRFGSSATHSLEQRRSACLEWWKTKDSAAHGAQEDSPDQLTYKTSSVNKSSFTL